MICENHCITANALTTCTYVIANTEPSTARRRLAPGGVLRGMRHVAACMHNTHAVMQDEALERACVSMYIAMAGGGHTPVFYLG